MKNIIQRQSVESSYQALPDALHPVLKRVYAARSIHSDKDLDNRLARLHSPTELKGIHQAVTLLQEALEKQERILVVGDFDADGATSSALMVAALRAMGAQRVDYLVPNRFEFGYGLTPEIVTVAAASGPDLLVTVDNGISSIEGVAAARKLGIRVLVTDHHLPGDALPAADAIVNPNQPGDHFPSKHLAGVGVAFYLLMALRSRLRKQGWFEQQALPEPNLAEYLDLVALGTVADLVALDHNNRVLVRQGLQRIRAGQCRPGIRALLQIAGRSLSRVVAADFGFAVGPRLNAAGRLDDMSIGIECLLSENEITARPLAEQLDTLNRERREIEADMKTRATEYVQRVHVEEAQLPLGLCLFEPDWHQGVIGILASRIKERFHRPVIAFARCGPDQLKGSARSISGLHIRDTLDAVAARHPDLLQKFGGHAMAAGLSLAEHRLPDFEAAFLQELSSRLDEHSLASVLESDGPLEAEDFNLDLAEQLRSAGPWGQGFPEPLFDGRFTIQQLRVVGEHHLKLRVRPEGGRELLDAIAFNQAADHTLRTGQPVRLAYRLDSNEYRGMLGLQLVVEVIEPLP
ncbi:MAG TPA: single-stranded-DNA-specific exonuclease RecJ [Gammaproteobacteria bacterium]|nr:single-stranded-DNA-specific exonuclease RecJ [Gammaproteobacteria bacterium]